MILRTWQCSDSQIDKQWSDGLGENKVLGMIIQLPVPFQIILSKYQNIVNYFYSS